MFIEKVRSFVILTTTLSLLAACQTTQLKTSLTAEDQGSFKFPGVDNYWKGKTWDLSGTLDFPEAGTGAKYPLIVLSHGSRGPGYRSRTWGELFREHGYATFRLDYYTQRGLSRGGRGGPKTSADIFSALSVLATHPRIDTQKVALMGFSRGGTITDRAISYSPEETGGIHPAAFVILYGGCIFSNSSDVKPDVPVLFLIGDQDDLMSADVCRLAAERGKEAGQDIRTVVYPGAHHGFDGEGTSTVQWGGKSVRMWANQEVTAKARAEVLQTLKRAFAKRS